MTVAHAYNPNTWGGGWRQEGQFKVTLVFIVSLVVVAREVSPLDFLQTTFLQALDVSTNVLPNVIPQSPRLNTPGHWHCRGGGVFLPSSLFLKLCIYLSLLL